jgi:hypothetical protein
VPEPFEVFVHHVRAEGRHPVEVHVPIEWVDLGANGEIVFTADGERVLDGVKAMISTT